jgi:uncharacterized protein involved in exopolysaccharide biosynthesis
MNDKLTSLSHDCSTPRAIFLRVAVTVFLLCCMIATAIAFLLPERYASDSGLLIKYISDRSPPQKVGETQMTNNVVQTEMAMFARESVLVPVIDNLDLKTVWGKKYANGTPLKTSEAVEMLKSRFVISPGPEDGVIKIRVVSDDKNEPTRIAEELIRSYKDYSDKAHSVPNPAVEKLENQINQLHASIDTLSKKVAALQQQFHISKDATGPQSPEEQPYWDAKRELEEQVQAFQKMIADSEKETIPVELGARHISHISMFQSPTPAYLVSSKPRIIFYGAVIGIFLGLLTGGAAALLAARRGNFTPQNIAVAGR